MKNCYIFKEKAKDNNENLKNIVNLGTIVIKQVNREESHIANII